MYNVLVTSLGRKQPTHLFSNSFALFTPTYVTSFPGWNRRLKEREREKKDEPELLDIFFSPAKVLMVIHNYFPCYGLYFHPETIHISPPADVNQNTTSLGLLTDLLSFVFPSPSQRF